MDMDKSVNPRETKNNHSDRFSTVAGTTSMKRMVRIEPTTINGTRLPYLLVDLSLIAPKIGSMNSAKTLSIAIIEPASVSPISNVFLSINGTTLSYICQKALIDKKANPTRIVRL